MKIVDYLLGLGEKCVWPDPIFENHNQCKQEQSEGSESSDHTDTNDRKDTQFKQGRKIRDLNQNSLNFSEGWLWLIKIMSWGA